MNHINKRLNVLFLIVFLLFAALIVRLGIVQIAKGDEYKSELDYVTTQKVYIDAPRGLMYDAHGHVVVANSLELSVTYTNPGDHTEKEQLELARKLANVIHFELEMPSFRDKQEYYYADLELNERKALLDGAVFEQDDSRSEYERIIDQITEQMVEEYAAEEEDAIYIFSQMARGSKGVPHRIKQSITDREANQLAERLDKLPHIDLQRDSKRTYVYGDTLRTLFGRVGPIQSEETEVYLTEGYERSDLVGTSYLELEYENVLKGQKGERTLTRQSNGNEQQKTTVSEEVGSRGNDLVLTIDMAYQQLLDQSVKKHVEENRGRFVEDASAYAVVINPKTGYILALSGYADSKDGGGAFQPLGTVNFAYEFGSAIKGASVLTGLEYDVINPRTVVDDQPLLFKGTPDKKSVVPYMGPVDLYTALERSSNVYMFEIAMRMGGYQYDYLSAARQTLFSEAVANQVLEDARYVFHQFGLGVNTGIDLPTEATGLAQPVNEAGNALDFMIGQYDTYSTLQIAQYISTIANEGKRMRPRLVKEIRVPETGKEVGHTVVRQFEPEVLNQIDVSQEKLEAVKTGLRRVVTGNRGTARMIKTDVAIAAKTGTSESTIVVGEGKHRQIREANNLSFVGFAPYDDPEIAFAVITPGMTVATTTSKVSQDISEDLVNHYFHLKENREEPLPN